MAMTLEQYYLKKIEEECAEVAIRASKASLFGLNEVQEGQSLTNEERLFEEFIDLVGAMEAAIKKGYLKPLSPELLAIGAERKKAKIEKYLKYSQERGRVEK